MKPKRFGIGISFAHNKNICFCFGVKMYEILFWSVKKKKPVFIKWNDSYVCELKMFFGFAVNYSD